MDILITCKPGFEKILARELALCGAKPKTQGAGWVLAEDISSAVSSEAPAMISGSHRLSGLCFACNILLEPVTVAASSVNSLADRLLDIFLTRLGKSRVDAAWGCLFFSDGNEQLIQHAATVKGRWLEQLRRKMSRVAKLAESGIPCGPKPAEGFFVHFIGHNQVQVSFRAFSQGQQRMKMDPQAPSRSYLKLEEAFHIFGSEPQAGETVVDLGAAPGGWTYSALKRGALVTAVDNGPLKEPVLSHSGVLHLRTDALKYQPESGGCVDWLLCDVLEQPDFILNLLKRWLGEQRCRRFVVNLKIGRTDPIPVLRDILDNRRGIAQHCSILKVRQLYHDREEITLMGDARV